MRTEQEIKIRIHELEETMNIAITRYYRGDDSAEGFKQVYSAGWDEMRILYWVLGNSGIEATIIVAEKVTKMSDDIKAAMTEIKPE